jgi:hypothetical protein
LCNNIESDHLIIIYSDHKIKYKVDHVINMAGLSHIKFSEK